MRFFEKLVVAYFLGHPVYIYTLITQVMQRRRFINAAVRSVAAFVVIKKHVSS